MPNPNEPVSSYPSSTGPTAAPPTGPASTGPTSTGPTSTGPTSTGAASTGAASMGAGNHAAPGGPTRTAGSTSTAQAASSSVPHGVAPGEIREHAAAVASDATELLAEARALVVQVYQALDIPGRMTRHPYQTMLVAAGIGYVLGGGLFTPLTARLVRTGARVAAIPLVKQELIALAETAVGTRVPTS